MEYNPGSQLSILNYFDPVDDDTYAFSFPSPTTELDDPSEASFYRSSQEEYKVLGNETGDMALQHGDDQILDEKYEFYNAQDWVDVLGMNEGDTQIFDERNQNERNVLIQNDEFMGVEVDIEERMKTGQIENNVTGRNHLHQVSIPATDPVVAKNNKLKMVASVYLEHNYSMLPENEINLLEPPNEVFLSNPRRGPKVAIDPKLTIHLKEHQIDGIKFMYNCCFRDGSGCILAHCMGLGKTFQTVTLIHTVINEPHLRINNIMIICPKSTIMNWKFEFEMWLSQTKGKRSLKMFLFPETSNLEQKFEILQNWSVYGKGNTNEAGCFLIGYEAFRILASYPDSKNGMNKYSAIELEEIRGKIRQYLLDPADVVICDEGHMIKNDKTTTSQTINRIRTKRRIVLTGTPMQNHLMEYYTMVNFIKPKFLFSKAKFEERYAQPIKDGQHLDSSAWEVAEMKKCSFALNRKLKVCVQRKEVSILKNYLPEKFEYVLFVPLSEQQIKLYKHFLDNTVIKDGKNLFTDYNLLRKIWTHPKVLDNAYHDAVNAKKNKAKRSTEDYNSENEAFLDVDSNLSPNLQRNWWHDLLAPENFENVLPSNKLVLVFEILKECQRKNEKCLIFSSFVQVLNVVEFFLKQINEQTRTGIEKPGLERFFGPWESGSDYFRLDGKTKKSLRQDMINTFNNPNEQRVRLFLISAKAGGQGINLVGANRVILLDTSWNPSNDQQNFFRVFRLGQKKNCYIYRLLAMGTMEEKIYSRSVTKQAMSYRVVDKQQVDRHYSVAELLTLYELNIPRMDDRPSPEFPKDELLAHLLSYFPEKVFKYHIHDTLLDNTEETDLTEEEKAEAWRKFEEDEKFDRILDDALTLKLLPEDPSAIANDPLINNLTPSWISSLSTVPVTSLSKEFISPSKPASPLKMDLNNNNDYTASWSTSPEMNLTKRNVNRTVITQPDSKKIRLGEINSDTMNQNTRKVPAPMSFRPTLQPFLGHLTTEN